MWFIVSIVAAVAFGAHPHTITSTRHFDTEAECRAFQPTDADELIAELHGMGVEATHLQSSCEIDQPGEPV